MIEKILIVYGVIALLHFIFEYRSIKKTCHKVYDTYTEKPKLDYCFFRALFFPVTWIRAMWKYTE